LWGSFSEPDNFKWLSNPTRVVHFQKNVFRPEIFLFFSLPCRPAIRTHTPTHARLLGNPGSLLAAPFYGKYFFIIQIE